MRGKRKLKVHWVNGVGEEKKKHSTITPQHHRSTQPNQLLKPINLSSNKPHLKNVGVRRGSGGGGLDRKLGRCIGHWVNGVERREEWPEKPEK